MKYITIALVVLVFIISVICYFLNVAYLKYKKKYEQEHEKLLGIQEEYSKLIEAYNIKKKNREKSDEKINNLRNGKLSADDILPKRKN